MKHKIEMFMIIFGFIICMIMSLFIGIDIGNKNYSITILSSVFFLFMGNFVSYLGFKMLFMEV